MSIFKKKDNGEIKYMNLTHLIKKQYGWNWRKLSIMDSKVDALKDIAKELEQLNKTLKDRDL